MKKSVGKSGFTLIELLVVVGIVVILAILMLPTGGPRKNSAILARCMSNHRQIGIGFSMWRDENGGKYPWQVPTVANGTQALITNGMASMQFLALGPYIKNADVYLCPSDHGREMSTNMQSFSDHNLSYFVGVDVLTNSAVVILTGDRHLQAEGKPVAPGLFQYTNGMVVDWSYELHSTKTSLSRGVLGFGDGHVQYMQGKNLDGAFKGQGMAGARLEVP